MFWLCSEGLFSLLDVLVFRLCLARILLLSIIFLGWCLLLMSLIFFSAFFIRGLAFSRGRVSLMTLNMSGFLGMKVDTKVRIGVSALSLFFGCLRSSIGISVAFCAPNSTCWTGYPCLTSVFFNSVNL